MQFQYHRGEGGGEGGGGGGCDGGCKKERKLPH